MEIAYSSKKRLKAKTDESKRLMVEAEKQISEVNKKVEVVLLYEVIAINIL